MRYRSALSSPVRSIMLHQLVGFPGHITLFLVLLCMDIHAAFLYYYTHKCTGSFVSEVSHTLDGVYEDSIYLSRGQTRIFRGSRHVYRALVLDFKLRVHYRRRRCLCPKDIHSSSSRDESLFSGFPEAKGKAVSANTLHTRASLLAN